MKDRLRHCPDPARWAKRIAASIEVTKNECWRWTKSLDRHGYGRFNVTIDGRRRYTGAHRASWLTHRGDIPGDLVIDHLCRNRACVNPGHMELVDNATNTIRGDHSAKKGRSGTRPGTQLHACTQHGRLDGYLAVRRSNGYTFWACRICRRVAKARYRARLTGA